MTAAPPTTIATYDPAPEIRALRPEIDAAIARVLDAGRFIGGPEVETFEAEAAAYLGVAHAVGLNSGTDALVIALRALGVGPGDEVVTTPFTFFATAEAISTVGATPVFADVDEQTFNLDPEAVEAAVTGRTRALLPVHLYGRPAPMDRLGALAARHGLAMVEDAAQAFGATVGAADGGPPRRAGAVGDVGAFSFFPTKPLGALGDGGLLATDDARVADLARQLRAHGGRDKYHNEAIGYNSRLDALQAAVLRVRLGAVDAMAARRRAVAARYAEALADVPGLVLPEIGPGHVVHQYTVRVLDGRRDAVAAALRVASLQTMVYYPTPCHRLPVYAGRYPALPVAERLAGEVLSLPMGPFLPEVDQARVAEAVRAALSGPPSLAARE